MTKETRIAMVVGLLFIVMFGVVLSDLIGKPNNQPPNMALHYPAAPADKSAVPNVEPPAPAAAPSPSPLAIGPGAPTGAADLAHADPCATISVTVLRQQDPAEANVAATVVPAPVVVPAPAAQAPVVVVRAPEPLIDPVPPVVAEANVARPVREANAVHPAREANQASTEMYTVKSKDTLLKIAKAFAGADKENEFLHAILKANPALKKDSTLLVDQQIVIPAAGRLPVTVHVASSDVPAGPTVRDMTLDELRRGLSAARTPTTAPAGDATASAGVGAATPAASVKKFYTVKEKDSLAKIARDQLKDDSKGMVQKLYTLNKGLLHNPDSLKPGMKLELPTT